MLSAESFPGDLHLMGGVVLGGDHFGLFLREKQRASFCKSHRHEAGNPDLPEVDCCRNDY